VVLVVCFSAGSEAASAPAGSVAAKVRVNNGGGPIRQNAGTQQHRRAPSGTHGSQAGPASPGVRTSLYPHFLPCIYRCGLDIYLVISLGSWHKQVLPKTCYNKPGCNVRTNNTEVDKCKGSYTREALNRSPLPHPERGNALHDKRYALDNAQSSSGWALKRDFD